MYLYIHITASSTFIVLGIRSGFSPTPFIYDLCNAFRLEQSSSYKLVKGIKLGLSPNYKMQQVKN